eukprot:Em0020g142a
MEVILVDSEDGTHQMVDLTGLLPTPGDVVSRQVLEMFPLVEKAFLEDLVQKNIALPDPVLRICDILLTSNYPKTKHKDQRTASIASCSSVQQATPVALKDPTRHYATKLSLQAAAQCYVLLSRDYPHIAAHELHHIAAEHNHHYAAAKRHIDDCLSMKMVTLSKPVCKSSAVATDSKLSSTGKKMRTLQLISNARGTSSLTPTLDPQLMQEVDFVQRNLQLYLPKGVDKQLLSNLRPNKRNSNGIEVAPLRNEGAWFECACCYVEAVFEAMVQCEEGHLFCASCLEMYVKEATYGAGKTEILCLSAECKARVPKSQLQRALPDDLLAKFEERQQEEVIRLAGIPGLFRCPSCGVAAEMPVQEKVFKCPNARCLKETCRQCGNNWDDHFGIPCKEMESRDDTKYRISIEELMTKAKIRYCHRCGCEFLKNDGCNKMTCRCGAIQCYACRKPEIDYSHFCPHPRDPGKPCDKCKNCSLWSDVMEDDERAAKEIQKKANEDASIKGSRTLPIGPPSPTNIPVAKRPRLQA